MWGTPWTAIWSARLKRALYPADPKPATADERLPREIRAEALRRLQRRQAQIASRNARRPPPQSKAPALAWLQSLQGIRERREPGKQSRLRKPLARAATRFRLPWRRRNSP